MKMNSVIELSKVKEEKFGIVNCDFYRDENSDEVFMTTRQLGEVLEYANPVQSISKMISRNPYLKTKEFSGVVALTTPQGGTQNTRVFTEDGIYEATLISSQPKAREFRMFVRKVIKELRRTGYVSVSNSGIARIDMMRNVLNTMEENIRRAMAMEKRQNQQQVQIESIEEKVEEITAKKVPENYINAARIAAKLDITSSNDRLHSALVGAIARSIGIKNKESAPYEDEYVKIVFGNSDIGEMIYYSPKAVQLIENYWNLKKDELRYEEYYKRDSVYGDKGDLRVAGYQIGRSKYKTYEAIKSQKLA
jgi:prophage antirepressor-like protein